MTMLVILRDDDLKDGGRALLTCVHLPVLAPGDLRVTKPLSGWYQGLKECLLNLIEMCDTPFGAEFTQSNKNFNAAYLIISRVQ